MRYQLWVQPGCSRHLASPHHESIRHSVTTRMQHLDVRDRGPGSRLLEPGHQVMWDGTDSAALLCHEAESCGRMGGSCQGPLGEGLCCSI